jgi:cbb3-type cytochrome oxidase cytochrome c subunit
MMTRVHVTHLALAGLIVGLASCNNMTSTAKIQPVSGAMLGDKPVDEGLAKRGAQVYMNKGCYTCHGMGQAGKRAGPDLLGIMERRDHTWLRGWLLNTDSMITSSDPQVKAMLEEWKGMKMPQIPLNSGDVDALFHYMAHETARLRAAGK